MHVKLPVGIENFEKIRTEGFYYVDKTGLIRELMYNWGEVNLFTRPRRFGKSLNMNMLKTFFEYGCNSKLFEGLEIEKEKGLCQKYMGKFPVISISLKDVSGMNYTAARSMMCTIIGKEALRFQFLLQSRKLTDKEKEMYNQLTAIDRENDQTFHMSDPVLTGSLQTLTMLLEKHYEHKVIVLIDEYDVPLSKAFDYHYYPQMIQLIRNMFEQVLKTNHSLYFAVLTGCMRISKESIFTGLNNPKIMSIMDVEFDEYFGFTDREVQLLLEYYSLSDHYSTIKNWYDGYRFGNISVYCPWDVICHCSKLWKDTDALPQDYWSNTSGNEVVKHFIEKASQKSIKREIERLIAGEAIEKEIRAELTYPEMYQSIDNLWSVLLTSGYLTQQGRPQGDSVHLVIPNIEIRRIFTKQIMEYFQESIRRDGESVNEFCTALKNGDATGVEMHFNRYLKETISIRDTFVKKKMKENFYHGILLGLLGFKESWDVTSNKESGSGYSDIMVEIDDEDIGIIIEMKYSDNKDLEKDCMTALEQITKNQYEETLLDEGIHHILKYGIACYNKQCRVMLAL